MLKALAVIAAILVVAAAVVLVWAATKPDTFRVERSATIKAPPEKIFPLSPTSISGDGGRPTKRAIPI